MADYRNYDPDLPDGFAPDEPLPERADDAAGQGLWRMLQEEGHLAAAETAAPKPAPVKPFPATPEEHAEPLPDDPDTVAGNRMRRLIESPDAATEEDLAAVAALTAAGGAVTDFDPALASFLRNEGNLIACRKHPARDSVAQCPECQAFYCQECLVVRRGRMLCRDCAETLFVATEEEIIAAQAAGAEAPETEVLPEAPPEFQLGSFGLEGAPASPLKKTLAWAIDFALTRVLLVSVVALLAGWDVGWIPEGIRTLMSTEHTGPWIQPLTRMALTLTPMVFWLPVAALCDFLYYFICLSFFNRTVGMSWTGCRVVGEWGDFATFGQVGLRTVVFILCLELPAILFSFFLRAYRGPHDLAAGTIVINYSGNKRVDAYESVQIRL